MKNRLTPLSIIGLVFSFATSVPAAAYSVSGNATAQAGGNRAGTQPVQQTFFSGSSANGTGASNVYNSSLGVGNSVAQSSAQAGALRAIAASDAEAWVGGLTPTNSQGDVIFTVAEANARLYDDFIVRSGHATDGSRGTITIAYSIDGGLLYSGGGHWSGRAQWFAHVSAQGTRNGGGYTNSYWSGGERVSDAYNQTVSYVDYDSSSANHSLGPHTLTFGVFFGSPVLLDIGVNAHAQAQAGSFCEYVSSNFVCNTANAAFSADIGHAIRWDGIVDVRDAIGTPITDFTALSATSGFDYAAPYPAVPEPEEWAMLLLGFGMVGWQVKRKQGRIAG